MAEKLWWEDLTPAEREFIQAYRKLSEAEQDTSRAYRGDGARPPSSRHESSGRKARIREGDHALAHIPMRNAV